MVESKLSKYVAFQAAAVLQWSSSYDQTTLLTTLARSTAYLEYGV